MADKLALPQTGSSWSTLVVKHGINDQSISTFDHAESGSKIGLKQFLLLRVLWATDEARKIQGDSEWHLNNRLKTAGKLLRDISDWKQYTSSCHRSLESLQDQGFAFLGTFALVLLYQRNTETIAMSSDSAAPKLDLTPIAMRTRARTHGGRRLGTSTPPSPTPLTLPRDLEHLSMHEDFNLPDDIETASIDSELTELSISENMATSLHISPRSPLAVDVARSLKSTSDEQLVNMALLAYLDALFLHFPHLKASWTPERRAFAVKNRQLDKIYEARVDGFLRRRIDDEIIAIIEVKPYPRTAKLDEIRMQESAQMAAWISQHPPTSSERERVVKMQGGKFRRLLVSQDRHQIFVTFAQFDSDYVDYICDRVPSNAPTQPSFLQMKEYGPFDIDTSSHMSGLGQFLLAFCL